MQDYLSDGSDETVTGTQGPVSVVPSVPVVLPADAAVLDSLIPGNAPVVSSWQPSYSSMGPHPSHMTDPALVSPLAENGTGTDAAPVLPTAVPCGAAAAPTMPATPAPARPTVNSVYARPAMTALKFLGMHNNGQPVFEQLPYDARNNDVFAASGGELVYQTVHGCLPLPYIPLHITPVSWTPCIGVQQTQPQQEPPRGATGGGAAAAREVGNDLDDAERRVRQRVNGGADGIISGTAVDGSQQAATLHAPDHDAIFPAVAAKPGSAFFFPAVDPFPDMEIAQDPFSQDQETSFDPLS